MSDLKNLHRDAMQIADRAIEARREDRGDEARSLFRQACQLESQAAMVLAEDMEAEPTRSVLFRSAATLALNGELRGYAAYLVARGLEGTPPAEIREELREVLKSIHPELLADASFPTSPADGDRLERFLSATSDLASTFDDIRKTLAEGGLTAGQLSDSLIPQILGAARDALQKHAPGAEFSLSLFGLRPGEAKTWESVSSRSDALSEDWRTAAKILIEEQEEAVLRGQRFAASTQDLADRGILSAEAAEFLRTVGVCGAAAWPVCAYNAKRKLVPALALLGVTSDPAMFAGDLAKRLLRQAVSLLELGIIIGQRDEQPTEGWKPDRDASQPE